MQPLNFESCGCKIDLISVVKTLALSVWVLFLNCSCNGRAEKILPVAGATTSTGGEGLVLSLKANRTAVQVGDSIQLTEELINTSGHSIFENFRTYSRSVSKVGDYIVPIRLTASGRVYSSPTALKVKPFEAREPKFEEEVEEEDVLVGFVYDLFSTNHGMYRHDPNQGRKITQIFSVAEPGIFWFKSEWLSNYPSGHHNNLEAERIQSNHVIIYVMPRPDPAVRK